MTARTVKQDLRSLPLLIIMIVICYGLLLAFVTQFPASGPVVLPPIADEAGDGQRMTYQAQSAGKPVFFQLALDAEDRHRIFWTLDYETETATIEVRARLERESDWFAIGFSDYGNVSNADLCVLWFDSALKSHFDVSRR